MKWTTELWKIREIHADLNNPRLMSKEQALGLQTSMERFGVCQPLVITREGVLIGGHQRLSTAIVLGLEEIEVAVPDRDLSPEEIEELSIRLNRNCGEWDYDILGNRYELPQLLSWGFSEKELGVETPKEISEKVHKCTLTSLDREALLAVSSELSKILLGYPAVEMKVSR